MQKIILFTIGILVAIVIYVTLTETQSEDSYDKKDFVATGKLEETFEVKDIISTTQVNSTTNVIISESIRNKMNTVEKAEKVNLNDIEAYKSIFSKTLELKRGVVHCLRSVDTFEDAMACNKSLNDIYSANMSDMDDMSDINMMQDETLDSLKFEWNEEIREEMISVMERSIEDEEEIESCMQAATTKKEIEHCYGKENII